MIDVHSPENSRALAELFNKYQVFDMKVRMDIIAQSNHLSEVEFLLRYHGKKK